MTVKELKELLDRYEDDREVAVMDVRFGEMRVKAVAPYGALFKRGPFNDPDNDWEGGIAIDAPVILTRDEDAEFERVRYEKAIGWVCRND